LILVIDSGVWISALQFKGTPLLAVEQSIVRYQIAICEPILREIHAALHWKFGWTDDEVEEVFAFYLSKTNHVKVSGKLRGVCRDPNDDMVFECAALAGASIIVASDKDLLAVVNYEGIRILTPREFLELPESPVP
jgi:putative PIN family toxin of toxin-antitoxin system